MHYCAIVGRCIEELLILGCIVNLMLGDARFEFGA
jgi:hypothetical protein